MKTTKLLIIALVFGALAGSSAIAGTVTRTTARPSITAARPSINRARPSINRSATAGNRWNNYRHYRSRSNVFFDVGFGAPFYGYGYGYGYPGYGYGYPYYDSYPYGYGYNTPNTQVYASRGINDDATVAAVQRRLARGGYYHGSIDGVIGPGTRIAIRAFERRNGLPVDGVIDPDLLRTMGLA
jgi:hypothetical protein